MNKTYCDRCGEEIRPTEIHIAEINNIEKKRPDMMPMEICPQCMVSIKEFCGGREE